jgi:hypothetical protein
MIICMDLNDIQLNHYLLTALFGNQLVHPGPGSEIPPIQFLGKNLQRFVVLVNYATDLHLPDESFQFLSNVLKACDLNAGDIAIVNMANQQVLLPRLLQQLEPLVILDCCGKQQIDGLPVAITLQPFKTAAFQYMLVPSLSQLCNGGEAVKPQKKQLWEGLKLMLQLP